MHAYSIGNFFLFLLIYLIELSDINILLKFCYTTELVISPYRLVFNVHSNVLLRRLCLRNNPSLYYSNGIIAKLKSSICSLLLELVMLFRGQKV